MALSVKFCCGQIERLQALPYYSTIGPVGFETLWNALRAAAPSEEIARGAIDSLLADTARASATETNRVPSPGELRVWVGAQIENGTRYWKPEPPPTYCLKCGGSGWVCGIPMTFDNVDEWETAKVPCPACQP